MKYTTTGFITLASVLMPAGAFAHGGHIGSLAGHDHVVIGVVLGGLVLAGLLAGAAKGKKSKEEVKADNEGTPA